MQAQAPGSAPQTAGLLRFQSRPQAFLAGWGGSRRLQSLLVALNPLLDQHTRHVADRSRLRLSKGRQPGTQILRKDHLDPGGLGLPAG